MTAVLEPQRVGGNGKKLGGGCKEDFGGERGREEELATDESDEIG